MDAVCAAGSIVTFASRAWRQGVAVTYVPAAATWSIRVSYFARAQKPFSRTMIDAFCFQYKSLSAGKQSIGPRKAKTSPSQLHAVG